MKICFQVLRQASDRPPQVARFTLDDVEPGQTILDCLNRIKWEQDGSLAFRRNCRNTICGSCALRINGRSSLACKENVGAVLAAASSNSALPTMPPTTLPTVPPTTLPTITIAPLGNLPVVRDLIVDMQPFWQKLVAVDPAVDSGIDPGMDSGMDSAADPAVNRGVDSGVDRAVNLGTDLAVHPTPAPEPGRESRQTPQQRARLEAAGNCILCGACYSACNGVEVNPEFVGPHALAKAQRLLEDPRDRASTARLDRYGDPTSGVWACTRCQNCNDVCPMEVAPLDRISTLKQHLLARATPELPPGAPRPVNALAPRPVRHRQILVDLVRSGGWIDERQFALRLVGNGGRDWRSLLALAPLGWRLLRRGKLPLGFHPAHEVAQVRGLIDAVRAVDPSAAQPLASPVASEPLRGG